MSTFMYQISNVFKYSAARLELNDVMYFIKVILDQKML